MLVLRLWFLSGQDLIELSTRLAPPILIIQLRATNWSCCCRPLMWWETEFYFLASVEKKSGSHDVVYLMRIRVLSKSLSNCDRKPSSKPYRSKVKWVLVWSKSVLKPSCNPICYSLNHSLYKNTCNLDIYKVDRADSSWTRRGSTALTSGIRSEVERKAFYKIWWNGKTIPEL